MTLRKLDTDTEHKLFSDNIVKIINESFPIKQKYIRQKTIQNKWLSKELLQEIKLKNRLYARKLKKPTSTNIDLYCTQLKKVEKSKKIEKRNYFSLQLEKYNSNIKND